MNQSNELLKKHCVPCEGGEPPMIDADEDYYLKRTQEWSLSREGTHHITRDFSFRDFREAMRFLNELADLAESEGHHPDIALFYYKLSLTLYTHAVKGLSLNDFILASKIDRIFDTYGNAK